VEVPLVELVFRLLMLLDVEEAGVWNVDVVWV